MNMVLRKLLCAPTKALAEAAFIIAEHDRFLVLLSSISHVIFKRDDFTRQYFLLLI